MIENYQFCSVELKTKQLQKELFELRKTINSKTNLVKVEAIIKIE